MARPQIEIDEDTVEKLAAICCTNREIASIVGCSVDTLERRFAAILDKGRQRGKINLRRKQYDIAMTGNVTMLIWLGKQMLDQQDKVNQQLSGDKEAPLQFEGSFLELINAVRPKK